MHSGIRASEIISLGGGLVRNLLDTNSKPLTTIYNLKNDHIAFDMEPRY